MVKKLESIISKVPPATVNNPVINQSIKETENLVNEEKKEDQDVFWRITAEVPKSVKIQMKERLFKHPEETERSIILKALRSIGFDIEEKHLNDLRKSKKRK
jgi:hypothetical protein